ncbi:MAG: formylglycine-generating enzyme family protein [Tepidisphaeraceae bacterium]
MPAAVRKTMQAVAGLLLIAALSLDAGCTPAVSGGHADPSTAAAVAPSDAATPSDVPPNVVVNSIGMWLAPVNPGEFVMGSPPDEAGHDSDETQHKVRITKPFLLSVYLVTQSEYAAVMGKNPSYFRGDDDLPVDSVSWNDAVEFCKKLSAKEGRTYRLPTEAEWEYACRAGSTGPYAGDGKIDDISWYWSNSGDVTHPVGTLQPNDWGFYDMQGDLWEWCADWYGPYPPGDATDPTGPATGTSRILRGGTVEYDEQYCRSAFRNYYPPETQLYYIGFRVAMDAR